MVMNKKMQELIQCGQASKFIFNENIKRLFIPNFIKIYDCIIISDDQFDLSVEDFARMISKKTNKSGYEYSCNETLINSYVEDITDTKDLVYIGRMIIELWSKQLKAIECESTFCFILSIDECSELATIFFHKYRNEEGMWISDNLELFNQPVGYILI